MMSMIAISPAPPRMSGLAGWLAELRRAEPVYFGLGLVMLFCVPPTLFAAFVDDRLFQGGNVWIKPLKFELALGLYLLTLAVFARWVRPEDLARRWYRVFRVCVAAAVVFEMLWIGGAAMLATASHFNRSPLGMTLYPLMGLAAILLTSATTVMAWQLWRNRASGLSPVVREAVVLGLALTLPLTLLTAGTMASMQGHMVGPAGSGEAAAFFGWARQAGDLRVAHFFATHALHAVPLFGLLSLAVFGAARRSPLRLFTAAYSGFVVLVFAQALSGRPFMAGIL